MSNQFQAYSRRVVLTVIGIPLVLLSVCVAYGITHPLTPEQRAEIAATRAAEDAEEKRNAEVKEAKRRHDQGYLDAPEHKQAAKDAVTSAGYSCPDVHGVRAMGDKGRGQVLRVQCTNNVFFSLTLLPNNRGYTVTIAD